MERINRLIQDLSKRQWLSTIELNEWDIQLAEYVKPGEYVHIGGAVKGDVNDYLTGTAGTTYFLRLALDIPESWGGDSVGLIIEAGGEGLVRINGIPYHGLDSNHTYVPLFIGQTGMNPVVEIEMFDPISEPKDPLNRQATLREPIRAIRSRLARGSRPLQSLVHSLTVARDTALLQPDRNMVGIGLREALYEAMDAVERHLHDAEAGLEWAAAVEETLRSKVRALDPERDSNGKMHMVGQSHIDVAWLWPVRETVRKSSRTFSTVCALMDEYPEFRYTQSQPLLYAFVKEHYPELYERVKARIAEGRWELVGGMWVEPDLNLPSGESLIRQLLHGQRFYREEFGQTSTVEWLPDTFGYCASLPQILKHAGVQYFMTTKLNWNDTNIFPHDLFQWTGIDGTSMLTYLNHGVNEHTHPKDVHEHWESFRQKDRHDEQMLLYGHGDGGGGVTREMAEYASRSELMPGLPAVQFSTALEFFEGVGADRADLPVWRGDLYLELHRGTYTTHARNKRWNRKAEVLYREAEIWNTLAAAYASTEQQAAFRSSMEEGWKLVLLNQFHDIIPGSSIPEVYVTSEKEYERVFAVGEASLDKGIETIAGQVNAVGDGLPYIVFNSQGWEREELVTIGGGSELSGLSAYDEAGEPLLYDLYADPDAETGEEKFLLSVLVPAIPAFGYTTIWLRKAEEIASSGTAGTDETAGTGGTATTAEFSVPFAWQHQSAFNGKWETLWYELEFNDRGEIVRWYDKDARRELLKPGMKANELQFFHDKPTLWDAWDIDPRYEDQPAGQAELLSEKVVLRGRTQHILRFEWRLNQSIIQQDLILYAHNRRVDFRTKVRWEESHKLLKAAFPLDLVADKATYEIPFGALERPTHRNTSWEQAQYEVCGHRWADMSENGYGVSLLNDCKYGYDAKEGQLRLSLLRAPKWPDLGADQGWHEFTYSVYPHGEDWRKAHIVRRAAELNAPVLVQAVEANAAGTGAEARGSLPPRHSLIGLQSRHVILDTVKPAEDGSGTILRFYESSGGREQAHLNWPLNIGKAVLVNALEDELEELAVDNDSAGLTLDFRPYEIKSIKISG